MSPTSICILNINKKASYRKQIARQEKFGQGWGRGRACENFPVNYLITLQNWVQAAIPTTSIPTKCF